MKKSLFLSTLIAATALALPAFAEGDGTQGAPYTGTESNLDLSGTSSDNKVYFKDASVNWVTGSGPYTFAADIDISTDNSGGLTITSGSADSTYTFSGAITGSGDWTITDGVAQNYVFTGDLSGYAGDIIYFASSVTGSLTFGDGSETSVTGSVSGTGQLVFAGDVTYKYGSGQTVKIANSSGADSGTYDMKVTNLTFDGSANYVVEVAYIQGFGGTNNDGHTAIGSTSYNHITISTTGSVTFAGVSGSMVLDYLGTFTVAEGSTLIIASDCTMGFHYGQSGYGLFVNGTLEIAEGASLTVNKHNNGSGADVSVANLKLDNGSTFAIRDAAANTISLGAVTVADNGSATIAVGVYDQNDYQDKIVITSLTGTNATLTLDSAAQTNNASIFELGGNNTSTTFTGKITLTDDASGSQRGMTLVISDAYIAAGAVIEMGSEAATSDTLALGVNASTVEIAGLVSASGHTGADIVYSGTVSLGSALGSGGTNLINGSLQGMNTSRNTLAINTAEGKSYEFNGIVLTMLNIEKLGTGKQTIAFENGSTFDGSINVKAGTLALSGAAISSTGIIVASDATLTIDNEITLGATSDVTDVSSKISGTVTIGESGKLNVGTTTMTLDTTLGTSTAGTVTFTEGAQLILTDAFLASADEQGSITIIMASSITYNNSAISDDLNAFVSNVIFWSDSYELSNWDYSSGVLSASVTYLPEPSMFGLFLGIGAIGLVATRRRRRA